MGCVDGNDHGGSTGEGFLYDEWKAFAVARQNQHIRGLVELGQGMTAARLPERDLGQRPGVRMERAGLAPAGKPPPPVGTQACHLFEQRHSFFFDEASDKQDHALALGNAEPCAQGLPLKRRERREDVGVDAIGPVFRGLWEVCEAFEQFFDAGTDENRLVCVSKRESPQAPVDQAQHRSQSCAAVLDIADVLGDDDRLVEQLGQN